MGCVSSTLLNQNDDFSQLGGCHHFVKLTSSTYGLLNLDPLPLPSPPISTSVTPMTPPERFTINGKDPRKEPKSEPEVINFWELVSGLDSDTCRFSPLPEKLDLNWGKTRDFVEIDEVLQPLDPKLAEKSDNRVVIYTTSLRGVRRTFEECNAVKSAIESFGVVISERDVSMDKGFKEELSNLMEEVRNGDLKAVLLPPRVFVKGRYIGGGEEVMKLVEEGKLGELLKEIPRKKDRNCDGCGGLLFVPCSDCNGSCKFVEGWGREAVMVKCMECNENGLVRCPICS